MIQKGPLGASPLDDPLQIPCRHDGRNCFARSTAPQNPDMGIMYSDHAAQMRLAAGSTGVRGHPSPYQANDLKS